MGKFQKGQSGNPGGRPKDDVKELARQHGPEAVKRLVQWMASDNPKASVSAAQALLDRGYGKPHQTAEITHLRQRAEELTDDELAGFVAGERSEGVAETQGDPEIVH